MNDDTLSSLEKLLFDAKEVLKSQRARLSIEHEVERSNDISKHLILKVYDNVFTSKFKQDKD